MLYSKRITSYWITFFACTSCFALAWLMRVPGGVSKKQSISGTTYADEAGNGAIIVYPAACGTTTYIDKCATSEKLNAETGQSNYKWSTGSTANAITVHSSGVYWWETVDLNNNKVANGDFSAGNASFDSEYTYAAPTSNSVLYPEGYYTVTTNPSNAHSGFTSFGDHTTGTGNMMIVNGAPAAGVTIWKQTINIQPNTDYVFSVWFTSVNSNSPGKLSFSINGVGLGAPILLTSGTPDWKNFTVRWTSGSSSTAEIGIVNQNTATSGNDFALDDMVFAPVCRNYFDVTLRAKPPKPTIIPL